MMAEQTEYQRSRAFKDAYEDMLLKIKIISGEYPHRVKLSENYERANEWVQLKEIDHIVYGNFYYFKKGSDATFFRLRFS